MTERTNGLVTVKLKSAEKGSNYFLPLAALKARTLSQLKYELCKVILMRMSHMDINPEESGEKDCPKDM